MIHPSETELALLAGGDLGWIERWRIGRHVRTCAGCRAELDRYQECALGLRRNASGLPPQLNWERLAAEMTANIHLGLEAGECVTPVRAPQPRVTWRAAVVMAGMSAVLIAAWWMNPPMRREPSLRAAPRVEIRTTSAGLELNDNGNVLVLLHGPGTQSQRPLIVSAPGTLRARNVDTDTGQITINNVYAE